MICPNCGTENRPGRVSASNVGPPCQRRSRPGPHPPLSPPSPSPLPHPLPSLPDLPVERRYPILRTLSVIYKVLGGIAGALTLLVSIGTCIAAIAGGAMFGEMGRQLGIQIPGMGGVVGGVILGLISLLYGGFAALTLYGAGELINLFISMEEHSAPWPGGKARPFHPGLVSAPCGPSGESAAAVRGLRRPGGRLIYRGSTICGGGPKGRRRNLPPGTACLQDNCKQLSARGPLCLRKSGEYGIISLRTDTGKTINNRLVPQSNTGRLATVAGSQSETGISVSPTRDRTIEALITLLMQAEEAGQRFYLHLMEAFAHEPTAAEVWWMMGADEAGHIRLLEQCCTLCPPNNARPRPTPCGWSRPGPPPGSPGKGAGPHSDAGGCLPGGPRAGELGNQRGF
jgi:hypothetical protein